MDAGGFVDDDLCALLLVILNALKEYVAEHHNSLLAQQQRLLQQQQLPVSGLCAVVNDYDRLYDKAAELRDELLGREKLSQEKHYMLIDNVMDQLNDEQVRVSFEATRMVAFQVIKDATGSLLESSPFDMDGGVVVGGREGVGGGGVPSWVVGGGGGGGSASSSDSSNRSSSGNGGSSMPHTALMLGGRKQQRQQQQQQLLLSRVDVLKDARLTIKDYFSDLEVWLPGYFFAHVVKSCYESLVNLYMVSILRGRTVWGDVEVVAHRMRQDKQTLLSDFGGEEGWVRPLEEVGVGEPGLVFGAWDAMREVILKGGGLGKERTATLLMVLPPPWNVDAVLQIKALRGERLGDRKANQEARQKLVDWYRAELQPIVQGAALAGSSECREGVKEEEKTALVVGRELAWRLRTSPMTVRKEQVLVLVGESVYNG